MTDFLIKLFDVSLSACSIIVVVLLMRLLMKKAPAYIRCLLWALVGIRLLMPISIESSLSLVPSSTPVSSFIEERTEKDEVPPPAVNGTEDVAPIPPVVQDPQVVPDTPVIPDVNESLPITQSPAKDTEKDGIAWQKILFYVWAVGAVAMLAYMGISYARMRYKVKDALVYDEDVRIYNGKMSPFVLGILRPKIYLSGGFTDEQLACIISHEKAHIRRLDYIFKPVAYCILSLHWFNPLVWLSYALFCKDTELACDEKVISTMDAKGRKLYSVTLLTCSASRFGLTSPLAFGETAIKERVTKVMKYKKPSFWIILTAVVVCIAVAVFFITSPKENGTDDVSTEESAEQSPEQSAEESPEQSAVDSEDGSSVDESSELSKTDESVDISTDESADESEEVSTDISTDTSTEPEPTPPAPGPLPTPSPIPYQTSHETPETVSNIENDQRGYWFGKVHPAYVTVWNKAYTTTAHSNLKIKGMKIWLCDKYGNKLDYVYTNSNGIARFEISVKGDYYVCYDGDEVYDALAPAPAFSITSEYYVSPYTTEIRSVTNHKILYVYDKNRYLPFTIKTYDAVTKEPLGNVSVYRGSVNEAPFVTTGNDGSITINPLISYINGGASARVFSFWLDKEGYDRYNASYIPLTDTLLEVYLNPTTEHPYTIKIINQQTRAPIEGVELTTTSFSDNSVIYKAVSGEDGIVSGMKTSEDMEDSRTVLLSFSLEMYTKYGVVLTDEASLSLTLDKNKTEYIVYLSVNEREGSMRMSLTDEYDYM